MRCVVGFVSFHSHIELYTAPDRSDPNNSIMSMLFANSDGSRLVAHFFSFHLLCASGVAVAGMSSRDKADSSVEKFLFVVVVFVDADSFFFGNPTSIANRHTYSDFVDVLLIFKDSSHFSLFYFPLLVFYYSFELAIFF